MRRYLTLFFLFSLFCGCNSKLTLRKIFGYFLDKVGTTSLEVSYLKHGISNLEKTLNDTLKKVDATSLDVSFLKQGVSNLEKEQNKTLKKVDATSIDVSFLKQGVSNLEKKQNKTLKKVDATSLDVSSLRQGVSSLQKKQNDTLKKVDATSRDVSSLKQGVSNFKKEQNDTLKNVSALKQKVSELEKQLNEAEKELAETIQDTRDVGQTFCEHDRECFNDKSECVSNVCRCKMGYSLNTRTGECVTDCNQLGYGNTFSAYEGKYTTSGLYFETIKSHSLDHCKKSCLNASKFVCASFNYHHVMLKCYLLPLTAFNFDSTKISTGEHITYVQRNCVFEPVAQRLCKSNDDCDQENSECDALMCRCKIGYSQDPRSGKCFKDCKVYGATFNVYKRQIVQHHNEKVLNYTSINRCKEACLRSTDFECVSFDYNHAVYKCLLASVTVLTTPDPKSVMKEEHMTYVQRNCA